MSLDYTDETQSPTSPPYLASEFPIYADGDVIITLASNHIYQLHAHTLRANSVLFNGLLNPNNAREPTGKGKKTGICFRVEYVPGAGVQDVGGFRLLCPGAKSNTQVVFDNQNGKSAAAYERYRDFDNLFRIMYNQDAVVVEADDMGSALASCLGLLDVAERMGAARIVSPIIEHTLLRRGQVLYQSIQSSPIAWSDLSVRTKSERLFEESIIHLVGQWQALSSADKSLLLPSVHALCERKHEELKTQKKTVDLNLLGLYPMELLAPPDETPGRNKYSSKIYMWMALCYFRQWLSQSLAEGQGWPAPDGGASLYRKLASGGSAYLAADAMQNFHSYFPMSHKAQCCLEDRITRIKHEASAIVQDLMRDESQLDQRTTPVTYLTCCRIGRADYPWSTHPSSSSPIISPIPNPPPPPPSSSLPRTTSRSQSPTPRNSPPPPPSPPSSVIDPRLLRDA